MSSSPLSSSPTEPPANPPNSRVAKPRAASQKTFAQLAVIVVLSLFVVTIAVPQYLGEWAWVTPLKLPDDARNAMQAIPETGLSISGWDTQDQGAIELGRESWSIQQLSSTEATDAASADTEIFLLLRAQTYGGDQPEVEWIDVKGLQRWETDSYQTLRFTLPTAGSESSRASEPVQVTADFFRAWSQEQTYAVLQWYAWPTGGHPSPTRWFWADQKVQWIHQQRLPWTAVSVWIPIEALGDITPQQPLAESIGQEVQRSLLKTVFLGKGDSS